MPESCCFIRSSCGSLFHLFGQAASLLSLWSSCYAPWQSVSTPDPIPSSSGTSILNLSFYLSPFPCKLFHAMSFTKVEVLELDLKAAPADEERRLSPTARTRPRIRNGYGYLSLKSSVGAKSRTTDKTSGKRLRNER
uniref:Uncharacterized protein n=1 Tax=Populus alba TaxID=43335 RepID=A0A4V6A8E3_POPAL|nr:hypothetical protein D5086_0000160270 [Populus alba]